MKPIKALLSGVISVALMVTSSLTFAETAPEKFNTDQKTEIEKIVHQYIVNNPEVLLEAGRALQARQRESMMKQAQQAIDKNTTQLFKSNSSPVAGNAKGDINIVEFFDYQCIHCKRMTETMTELLKNDKNVRVVFKEFPIFGKSSEFAAKAALAANKQNKFLELHKALMATSGRLNDDIVLAKAKSVGINVEKLKKDIKSDAVAKELKDNMELAQSLGIMATPVFIIAKNPPSQQGKSHFIPGAVRLSMLESLIKELR